MQRKVHNNFVFQREKGFKNKTEQIFADKR